MLRLRLQSVTGRETTSGHQRHQALHSHHGRDAGGGQLVGQFGEGVLGELLDQVVAVGEVVVEGPVRDPGFGSDVADAERLTPCGDDPGCGVEKLPSGPGLLLVPARQAGLVRCSCHGKR